MNFREILAQWWTQEDFEQEPVLLQTDRATRCVSRNLVNRCTTVGISCTANPQQVEVLYYGRRICSKQPRRIDRRRCQLIRPLTISVDNTIDLPWRNFSEFRTEFQWEVPVFLKVPEFLITHYRIGKSEAPVPKNQLHSFSRFDRSPTCDRHSVAR